MNKKFLLILATVFILSCNAVVPVQAEPTVALSAPTATHPPEAVSDTSTNNMLVGYVEVRLQPGTVSLEEMLAEETTRAIAAGLLPVVEFDANWCPPCLAIRQHLEEKNQLMLEAYDGTYIIKLDVDEWGWDNGKVENFSFEAIPVYFKLDEQGKPTGEVIDGGAWNEDVPVNIAPVMHAFFHNK